MRPHARPWCANPIFFKTYFFEVWIVLDCQVRARSSKCHSIMFFFVASDPSAVDAPCIWPPGRWWTMLMTDVMPCAVPCYCESGQRVHFAPPRFPVLI